MNYSPGLESLLKFFRTKKFPEFKEVDEVCEYVTLFLVKKYNLWTESDINQGYCFIWAFLVWALWKRRDEIKFKSDANHIVIRCGKYYYDADYPTGNADDTEMLGNNMFSGKPVDLNLFQMALYWVSHGRRKEIFANVLESVTPPLYEKIAKKKFAVKPSLWDVGAMS